MECSSQVIPVESNAALSEQVIEYRQDDECTFGDYHDEKHLASAKSRFLEERVYRRVKMTLGKDA